MPVEPSDEAGAEIRTSFVRHRNVLVARGRVGDILVDYYLHLAQHGLRPDPGADRLCKEALAAMTLHAASRPRHEIVAWTLNFQQPLVNLFVHGDNEDGTVVARTFTENVKEGAENLFFADVVKHRQPPVRSVIPFTAATVFGAAEAFYARSEQRPARFFDLGDEEFALLSAHPDCDLDWLGAVTVDEVRGLEKRETVVPMERRLYRWRCGCNEERIMRVLLPAMRADPEALFEGDEMLRLHCPRCAGRYAVSREAMEAYQARHAGPGPGRGAA